MPPRAWWCLLGDCIALTPHLLRQGPLAGLERGGRERPGARGQVARKNSLRLALFSPHPRARVQVLVNGLVPVPAPYTAFVFLGISAALGGSIRYDLFGILSGHVWYFLRQAGRARGCGACGEAPGLRSCDFTLASMMAYA